jgi:hypothetical protein
MKTPPRPKLNVTSKDSSDYQHDAAGRRKNNLQKRRKVLSDIKAMFFYGILIGFGLGCLFSVIIQGLTSSDRHTENVIFSHDIHSSRPG